ncbi:MAG: FAD-dependent oxidoreductase [Ignavibacteriales bacterium]
MNTTYDYIVYGGNPAGVTFALQKRKQGEKVLLINHYGFLGGSISEGFNCLQKIIIKEGNRINGEVISVISDGKNGYLYFNDTHAVVNPEAVKMLLPELLISSGVELLCHVNPFSYRVLDNSLIEIELFAKEGKIKVSASHLLDASENMHFRMINGTQPWEVTKKVNLFITKVSNTDFLRYEEIQNHICLNDGRYWISLDCRTGLDDAVSRFAPVVHASGARIQLLPVDIYKEYEINSDHGNKRHVVTIEELLGKHFLPDEQLIKAAEIEKYLSGKNQDE